jgi:tRNA1(Val) A37 N6-methylase TrmN6
MVRAVTDDWTTIHATLEAELGERISIDGLTGGWKIAQRVAGHRHSADDVLTAAYALRHVAGRGVTRALDLGTGIGTVGLLVLWGLGPAATSCGVEAQELSYRLLRANLAGNGLAGRVEPRLGDLRELALAERFPLITGSPPYFPVGTGIIPADSQKAHARFELRGDVADYARAAARHLADDGVFVYCFPTAQRARGLAAAPAAGLVVTHYQDVIPREGLTPLFTLVACRWPAAATPLFVEAPFVVRVADGRLSPDMQQVRASFGFVVE